MLVETPMFVQLFRFLSLPSLGKHHLEVLVDDCNEVFGMEKEREAHYGE